jgi:hypothetical protein
MRRASRNYPHRCSEVGLKCYNSADDVSVLNLQY